MKTKKRKRIPRMIGLVLTTLLVLVSAVFVVSTRANAVSSTPVVYVATGENFPDALGAASAAAVNAGPVLLVQRDSIPSVTAAELNRLAPDVIYVAGGTAVVSDSVVNQLKSYAPSVIRLAGSNRYATAVEVSKSAFPAAGFGSGPSARAAGDRFASGDSPIVLPDDTDVELGALVISVPANGGVLETTASVMFETPETQGGRFTVAWVTLDQECTSVMDPLAAAASDMWFNVFDNMSLNAAVNVSAGSHTIRLCGWAIHDFLTDYTLVDAARVSAVWVPTAMGVTLDPVSAEPTIDVERMIRQLDSMRTDP